MKTDALEAILSDPQESQGVEFKGPGRRDDTHFFAVIAQAVLGMANRQGGGTIIVGVEESGGTFNAVGLTGDQLSTWASDHVLDKLDEYADPSVRLTCHSLAIDGRHFIVLEVGEFEDVPIACKRDFPGVLRKGAVYVRPRRKPETAEVGTQTDMRALVELATQKRLKQVLGTVAGAGAIVQPKRRAISLAGDVAQKIRSRGYWEVEIVPDRLLELTPAETEALVEELEVESFGWRFPRLYRDGKIERHQEFVSMESMAGEFLESWRFYCDGRFIWAGGLLSDWEDLASFQDRPLPGDWTWGKRLGTYESCVYAALAGEFISRFVAKTRLSGSVTCRVEFRRLRGRELYIDLPGRAPFSYPRRADAESYRWEVSRDASMWLGGATAIGPDIAIALLAMFKWDVDTGWYLNFTKDLRARWQAQ